MKKVTLQGKIVKKTTGNNRSIITLVVRKPGKKSKPDYPEVVFTKNENAMLFDFEVGDYVNIEGSVRTYAEADDKGKKKYQQFIRGLWIGQAKNNMSEAFGENIDGFYEYKNEVLIKGEVMSANIFTPGIWHMLIKPEDTNFLVSVSKYTNDKDIKDCIGKEIYAICSIQTNRKKVNNKLVKYQNIIVNSSTIISD